MKRSSLITRNGSVGKRAAAGPHRLKDYKTQIPKHILPARVDGVIVGKTPLSALTLRFDPTAEWMSTAAADPEDYVFTTHGNTD